jgi:hypothetical protein
MTPTSSSPIHQPIWALWICSIWIGTWSIPFATAQPELTFPYVAYVNASSANIHSGPGQRHYTTATLPVGFAVHVYRHDAPQQGLDRKSSHTENTWCAIRPPDGSISWIDSQQVRKRPDGTAEILGNQTLVRVGSQLSAKQNAVQVALSQGELVKLTTSGVASSERWLAIEPPAGEFRWILASQLSRQPLQGTQSKERIVSQGQSLWKSQHEARAARQARQETRASAISDRPSVAPSPSQPHTHMAHESRAHESRTAKDDSIHIITGSPADHLSVQSQQPLSSSDTTSPPASPSANLMDSATSETQGSSPPRVHFGVLTTQPNNLPGPFSGQKATSQNPGEPLMTNASEITPSAQNHVDRLSELQVRLSLMVVQDPKQWQFEQLRQEANNLISQSDSSIFRDKTRDFLGQITLFERVRSRRIEPAVLPTRGKPSPMLLAGQDQSLEQEQAPNHSTDISTGNLSTLQPQRQQDMRQRAKSDLDAGRVGKDSTEDQIAARNKTSDTVRYDAVGLLKPVVSRSDHSPHYALVDDKGKVVSFVTPTTDVNLQPYIGRRIGVNGTRGFMPEYRRAHVMANRITPIIR